MKTLDNIIDAIIIILMVVDVVTSIIVGEFFAAFGWLTGLVMSIVVLKQDKILKEWENLCCEMQHDNIKLQVENTELIAQLRKFEREDKKK